MSLQDRFLGFDAKQNMHIQRGRRGGVEIFGEQDVKPKRQGCIYNGAFESKAPLLAAFAPPAFASLPTPKAPFPHHDPAAVGETANGSCGDEQQR